MNAVERRSVSRAREAEAPAGRWGSDEVVMINTGKEDGAAGRCCAVTGNRGARASHLLELDSRLHGRPFCSYIHALTSFQRMIIVNDSTFFVLRW